MQRSTYKGKRRARKEWAIQTPSGGIVRVKSSSTAVTATRAYESARWPLRWVDLQSQGYRVVLVSRKRETVAALEGCI